MMTTPESVPVGCRTRLTAHYGKPVRAWLEAVPHLLAAAASRWSLILGGYHDAGHSAVLAVVTTRHGAPAMLKAWFDRERYANETAALRHWGAVNGDVLLAQDDKTAMACLALIGGVPGGGLRPADDERLVAFALARLHRLPLPPRDLPRLDVHLAEIDRRTQHRAETFAGCHSRLIDLGLRASTQRLALETTVLLHGDLYQENVPFAAGTPVFLDPLPMLGDPSFDWAFFIVYYDLNRDPVARLQLAAEVGGLSVDQLRPWCLALCLDGLLYYHQVRDDREQRMAEVMLALSDGRGHAHEADRRGGASFGTRAPRGNARRDTNEAAHA